MELIDIHDAQSRFSRLVDRVIAGEEIVIAVDGCPVVRLERVSSERRDRVPGTFADRIFVSDGFHEPLGEDVLGDFYPDA